MCLMRTEEKKMESKSNNIAVKIKNFEWIEAQNQNKPNTFLKSQITLLIVVILPETPYDSSI